MVRGKKITFPKSDLQLKLNPSPMDTKLCIWRSVKDYMNTTFFVVNPLRIISIWSYVSHDLHGFLFFSFSPSTIISIEKSDTFYTTPVSIALMVLFQFVKLTIYILLVGFPVLIFTAIVIPDNNNLVGYAYYTIILQRLSTRILIFT